MLFSMSSSLLPVKLTRFFSSLLFSTSSWKHSPSLLSMICLYILQPMSSRLISSRPIILISWQFQTEFFLIFVFSRSLIVRWPYSYLVNAQLLMSSSSRVLNSASIWKMHSLQLDQWIKDLVESRKESTALEWNWWMMRQMFSRVIESISDSSSESISLQLLRHFLNSPSIIIDLLSSQTEEKLLCLGHSPRICFIVYKLNPKFIRFLSSFRWCIIISAFSQTSVITYYIVLKYFFILPRLQHICLFFELYSNVIERVSECRIERSPNLGDFSEVGADGLFIPIFIFYRLLVFQDFQSRLLRLELLSQRYSWY